MRVFLLHYYHIIHHSSPTWTSFTLCIDMHNIMMRRPAKSQFLVEKFCLSLRISSRRRHYIYTLMSQLETTTTLHYCLTWSLSAISCERCLSLHWRLACSSATDVTWSLSTISFIVYAILYVCLRRKQRITNEVVWFVTKWKIPGAGRVVWRLPADPPRVSASAP